MPRRLLALLYSVTLFVSTQPADAAPIVIDDFSVGSTSLSSNQYDTSTISEQTGLSTSHVAGGARRIELRSLPYSDAGQNITTRLDIDVNENESLWVTTKSETRGYFDLFYGYGTSLDLDLSDATAFRISDIEIIGEKAPNFDLTVTTGTAQGGTSEDTVWDFDLSPSGAPQDLVVPFSAFDGLDFSNVRQIRLDASRIPDSSAVRISSLEAVPEPATAAVLGLGLMALGIRRRPAS